MNVSDVLMRLKSQQCHPRRNGKGWTACCPAHDDSNPSLSVAESVNGGVVLHCHTGCTPEAVCEAIGIKLVDLMPPRKKTHHGGSGVPHGPIVKTYQYRDESGNLLFEVVRFEPKSFRQRRPDGDGSWVWNVDGVRRVLYKLPEVLAGLREGKTIFISEGEKDVEALVAAGFLATCNPGGAGKWRSEYNETFRGAEVVILPDKDEPGRKHAQAVATGLHGIAAEIRLVELPDVNGNPVKDAADFFSTGGTKEELLELVDAASAWEPDAVPKADARATLEVSETADALMSRIRGEIINILSSDGSSGVKYTKIARAVVAALCKAGGLPAAV